MSIKLCYHWDAFCTFFDTHFPYAIRRSNAFDAIICQFEKFSSNKKCLENRTILIFLFCCYYCGNKDTSYDHYWKEVQLIINQNTVLLYSSRYSYNPEIILFLGKM